MSLPALLALQAHALTLSRHVPARATVQAIASSNDWDERELWALEDNVMRFSLKKGRFVLWRRMAIEVAELSLRTPEQLRSQWLALQGPRGWTIAAENPPCLENWRRVPEGGFEGDLYGLKGVADGTVCATVQPRPLTAEEIDGQTTELGELEGWCVVTPSGDVFQLGAPQQEREPLDAGGALASNGAAAAASALDALPSASDVAGGLRSLPVIPPPVLWTAGALAVGAAAWALGGHHVDVSVFIV